MLQPDITAVDVFCGAAGLSLGLQSSGITIAAGIDVDPACRFPFEENIGATFIQADIATISPESVQRLFGDAGVRLLAGCAPCQPFSGYTTRRHAADNRWQLLLEFLRIVETVQPELVSMENVPRLAHLPLWKEFVGALNELGYHSDWKVVDAAKYGVPQSRTRLVLLASKLGPIRLPQPLAGERATVRSAIGAQPAIGAGVPNPVDPLHSSRVLTGRNLERIRASQPGGTWRDWPEDLRATCHRGEKGRTYPSVYGRMSWDRPSPTMTTQFYGFGNGRFGHPDQDRALTLREGALLQSFPADFKFAPTGSRVNFREIGRLIGNAVPPALGRALGSAIVEHVRQVSM
jgi:DNA (cytosine-5)-methyltransferase 1